MRTVVIYSGRFQPFHLGHLQVYNHFVEKFGQDNVFIATADSAISTERPFNYQEKQQIMVSAGIPSDVIHKVRSPYQSDEIKATLDLEDTVILFPLGEDDINRFRGFKPKKDGSPSYMQSFYANTDNIKSAQEHAYVMDLPRFDFKINGNVIKSGTELRKLYIDGDDNERLSILNQLYTSNGSVLKNLFDTKLIQNRTVTSESIMNEYKKFINSI